jgi:hypothetical protein
MRLGSPGVEIQSRHRFSDRELWSLASVQSHFLINFSTQIFLLFVIFWTVSGLLICIAASVRCPVSVFHRNDFFSSKATQGVVNFDIFLNFSGFSAYQDSLLFSCSIVLRQPARHQGAMTIGLTLDQTLYKDGIVAGRLPIPRPSLTVEVPPNSLVTSSFAVSNVSLLGTDSVQLMIQPRVNFSLISGFMFHSMWANLAAEHYFQVARFILTGAFCFMFLASSSA